MYNIEHIVALGLGYDMAWIGAGVMGLLFGFTLRYHP